MSDAFEGIPAETTDQVDTSVGGEGEATHESQPEVPKGNPAWNDIRSELGDPVFSKIEPHLRKFDSEHDRSISKLNEEYAWARELTKNGVTPQQVTASLQLARALDESPEQIYDRLGQFLQQQGRMPNSAAELEAKTDDPEDEEGELPDDPRIAALQEQNERMMQFLQEQQRAEETRQADASLDAEIEALKANTDLNLSKEDIREVLQRAVAIFHTTGREMPLADVAADYIASVRNRILSTTRPGETAPRLVPTSGGNAAVAQRKSYGEMSRGETQDLLASLVAQDNANAQG